MYITRKKSFLECEALNWLGSVWTNCLNSEHSKIQNCIHTTRKYVWCEISWQPRERIPPQRNILIIIQSQSPHFAFLVPIRRHDNLSFFAVAGPPIPRTHARRCPPRQQPNRCIFHADDWRKIEFAENASSQMNEMNGWLVFSPVAVLWPYNVGCNTVQTRASEAGVCRGSDTPKYLCGGILICISPPRKI